MILPEIVREITEKYDLPYSKVNKIVRHIFNDIKEALSKGGRVEIRDFGIFSLRSRDERVTRNPKTGENLVTPRKQVVHFKVGKELRERVKYKGI